MRAPKRLIADVEPLVLYHMSPRDIFKTIKFAAMRDNFFASSAADTVQQDIGPFDNKLQHGHESKLMKLANSVGRFDRLLRVCKYDSHGRGDAWGNPNSKEYKNEEINFNYAKAVAKKFGFLERRPSPIITGKDLVKFGLTPSEQFKKILQKCFEGQLDLEFTDHGGGMKFLEKILQKRQFQ